MTALSAMQTLIWPSDAALQRMTELSAKPTSERGAVNVSFVRIAVIQTALWCCSAANGDFVREADVHLAFWCRPAANDRIVRTADIRSALVKVRFVRTADLRLLRKQTKFRSKPTSI